MHCSCSCLHIRRNFAGGHVGDLQERLTTTFPGGCAVLALPTVRGPDASAPTTAAGASAALWLPQLEPRRSFCDTIHDNPDSKRRRRPTIARPFLPRKEPARVSSCQRMTTYKYQPLDAKQRMIRLITTHPGALSDDIAVSL